MVGVVRALAGSPRIKGALAAVAVFGLMLTGQGLASSPAGVLKVRFGGDQQATRVVVELDRSAKGRLLGDDPSKLVLALNGVGSGEMSGRGHGLVRTWATDAAAGGARLKLDLSRPAAVKRRFLLPPGEGVEVYRYVIDLEATGAKPAAEPARGKEDRAAPMKAVAERPARAKRVIVIDAGHGGSDPGASGQANQEKAITLAAARALKARLEKTGRYQVVMTRNSDAYVGLESRVAIARRADADLFISLHADAGADASLRGASVYTLSEKGADRAARKFAGDNWIRDGEGSRDPAVTRILLDLTQRATSNRSAVFAKVLLEHISERTTLLRRSHRDAGFAVLLAPDVPAVLLEMGFVTNPDDERLLSDAKKRERLMASVAEAVDAYFKDAGVRYASLTGGL